MVMGGCNGVWEGVITFSRCDSPQGGVKYVRNMCQFIERSDARGRSVQEVGGGVTVVRECDSHQGDVECIRKVCQLMERCDNYGGDVKVLGEV